jgi:hypothetical protein
MPAADLVAGVRQAQARVDALSAVGAALRSAKDLAGSFRESLDARVVVAEVEPECLPPCEAPDVRREIGRGRHRGVDEQREERDAPLQCAGDLPADDIVRVMQAVGFQKSA